MRELNKEECLEALEKLWYKRGGGYQTILRLIERHFDNEPLKFEDLKPNTLVWDNKYKKFLTIKETRIDWKTKKVVFYENIGENGIDIFANNRFFLKEVK